MPGWTRDTHWDAFARAGMLALCDVSINGTVHPGVYIGIRQPDKLYLDGASQQTDYEAEFETGSLPGLAVDDVITVLDGGAQYRVRNQPAFRSSTGWYSQCALECVAVAYPKAPLPLPSGDAVLGGDVLTKVAVAAVAAHRLVVSSGAAGCLHASNAVRTHGDEVIGIAQAAAAIGSPVVVQSAGEHVFDGWAWTPGDRLFCGVDGQLTQTPPLDAAAFTLSVGHAITATKIFIAIGDAVYHR